MFHRIEDIYQLDGPKFMRLAWRVSAYGGVMKLRLESQRDDDAPTYAPSDSRPARTARSGVQETSLAGFMLQFPGAVERTTVKG